MIPGLYAAAMEGQTESLNDYNICQIKSERTRNENTVLHVAAQFGQLGCVTKILERCPSLLRKRNLEGEIPLHMAAREGKLEIVKALTRHAKEVGAFDLLRATNWDKDTALHMAVQNDHFEMVSFLTSEDREYSYPANRAKETPLYLAVESNNHAMVVAILENCALRDYRGPDGRTALHEAVLINKDPAIATELLQWKPELIGKLDARGWMPLHYAAWCGNIKGVEVIVNTKIPFQPSTFLATAIAIFTELIPAYYLGPIGLKGKLDTRGWTPLHIAAAQGYVTLMKTMLSAYPEWWEIVDSRGDNILHVAVQFEREEVIEFIDGMSWSILLMNQKNNQGNTPLHFLAASEFTAKKSSLGDYRGYWRTFNNKNLRPMDVALPQVEDELECQYGTARNTANIRDEHDKLKKIEEERKARKDELEERKEEEEQQKAKDIVEQRVKIAKSQMIVASLLATITFAAAFTIPGGYDPNPGSEQGTAILARVVAFKTFIFFNAIAVICAIASVYQFVTTIIVTDEDKQALKYLTGVILLLDAIVATTIAFMTGTYSMLPHGRLLPVPVWAFGSLFVLYCLWDFLDLARYHARVLNLKDLPRTHGEGPLEASFRSLRRIKRLREN